MQYLQWAKYYYNIVCMSECVHVWKCMHVLKGVFRCMHACFSTRTLKLWSKLYIFWNTGLLIQDFPSKKVQPVSDLNKVKKIIIFSPTVSKTTVTADSEILSGSLVGQDRQCYNETKLRFSPHLATDFRSQKLHRVQKVQKRSFINSWHYIYWWPLRC